MKTKYNTTYNGESEYALPLEIRDGLGYEYMLGRELSAESGERSEAGAMLLERRLKTCIERLNPWLKKSECGTESDPKADTKIDAVMEKLKVQKPGRELSLVSGNEALHELISRETMKLEIANEKGEKIWKNVKIMDFENPSNNEFLISVGFEVKTGQESHEFDILVFINGIPVLACERRQDTGEMILDEELMKRSVFSSFSKLLRSSGAAKMLMACALYTNNHMWTGSGFEDADSYTGYGNLNSMTWRADIFKKETLLELVKSGIWFENSPDTGNRIKKIAALSTVLDSMWLVGRMKNGESAALEMFYHTDSDSAIRMFVSNAVSSGRIDGCRLAVLTKRARVQKLVERVLAYSAKSIRRFKRMEDFLFEGAASGKGGVIFIGEYELGRTVDLYCGYEGCEEASDILFIIDGFEHRADWVERLKRTFRNCRFFEFRWTNKKTNQNAYAGSMDNQRLKSPAIATEEGHITKVLIKNKKAGFDTEDSLRKNIAKKAADICNHYMDSVYSHGFKGFVICGDSVSAKMYYEELSEAILGRIHAKPGKKISVEMLVEGEDGHEAERLQKALQEPVEREGTVLVVADYIPDSSFEATYVKSVYSDCRVDSMTIGERALSIGCIRAEGKSHAIFMDYFGIFPFGFAGEDEIRKNKCFEGFAVTYESMKKRIEYLSNQMKNITGGERIDDRIIRAMGNESTRAEYEMLYRELAQIMEEFIEERSCAGMRDDLKYFSHVSAVLKAAYSPQKGFDMGYMGSGTRAFLNEYFSESGTEGLIVPISVFDRDFSEKVCAAVGSAARSYIIENAIRWAIDINIDKNPGFYEMLMRKLETILVDTQNDFLKREESLRQLVENYIEDDIIRARRLGISIDEYRVMKIIEKFSMNTATKDIIGASKGITSGIMDIVEENFTKKWNVDSEKLDKMKLEIEKLLLREYAEMFKMDDMKSTAQELLGFAAGRYETLDFKDRVKEITVDDFMKEILG